LAPSNASHLGPVQVALGAPPARVADQAGGAADHRDGMVPRELQPAHRNQLDQVAEVEALRRRVEAAVEADRVSGQHGAQAIGVRAVGDKASPVEVVEEVSGHEA